MLLAGISTFRSLGLLFCNVESSQFEFVDIGIYSILLLYAFNNRKDK